MSGKPLWPAREGQKNPGGRPKKPDPLVKPMHLRLSVSQDAYVAEKAETWGVRRQDAVRRIIAEHMHTEEQ